MRSTYEIIGTQCIESVTVDGCGIKALRAAVETAYTRLPMKKKWTRSVTYTAGYKAAVLIYDSKGRNVDGSMVSLKL